VKAEISNIKTKTLSFQNPRLHATYVWNSAVDETSIWHYLDVHYNVPPASR